MEPDKIIPPQPDVSQPPVAGQAPQDPNNPVAGRVTPQPNNPNPAPGAAFPPGVDPAADPAITPAQPPAVPTDMPLYVPEVANESTGDTKRKRILIVLGSLVGLLVLFIIIGIALSGNQAPPPKQANTNQEPQGPQPAQALDVEQTNDSINQDISGLNDLSDFPETELQDQALGL